MSDKPKPIVLYYNSARSFRVKKKGLCIGKLEKKNFYYSIYSTELEKILYYCNSYSAAI